MPRKPKDASFSQNLGKKVKGCQSYIVLVNGNVVLNLFVCSLMGKYVVTVNREQCNT